MRSAFAISALAAITSVSAQNLDVAGYRREDLGTAAINAPIDNDCFTFIQHSIYKGVKKIDPARCIRDCEETTKFNRDNLGGRAVCRFVNTYLELKNGKSQGQVCSMYTTTWDRSFANNFGYIRPSDEAAVTIKDSYSYSNVNDPGNRDSCVRDDPRDVYPPCDEPPKDPNPGPPPAPQPQPPVDPPKPDTDICFKGRAVSFANRKVNGRWLQSTEKASLAAYWKKNERDASTFFIDQNGVLRNAETLGFAVQDTYLRRAWGYVDFRRVNNRKNSDPALKPCRIQDNGRDGKSLVCQFLPTDAFFSKGFYLAHGTAPPKSAKPVRIEVIETRCPRPFLM